MNEDDEYGGPASNIPPDDRQSTIQYWRATHQPPKKKKDGSGVGPPYKPGLGVHTHAASSIFDDYSGPQVDAAKTLIRTEMALLGFPQNVDTEQMTLYLLKNNLENQPQAAYEALWNSKFMTNDMRKASPWARFGQDADTFHMNLTSAQDTILSLTGMNINLTDMLVSTDSTGSWAGSVQPASAMAGATSSGPGGDIRPGPPDPTGQAMQELLQAAVKGNLSQAQIMQMLQAGSFKDIDGQNVDLTGITAAQPWLLSGQSYQSQAQQFHTIYGAAPVDTAQLAGWYRFNQSAASMGPWYARQAVVEAPGKMPTAVGQTEVR